MRIVVVTGLSGAGKSTVLDALEDVGMYCVDNIPLPRLDSLIQFLSGDSSVKGVAIGVDARQHRYLDEYHDQLAGLRTRGHDVDELFLEASDAVLQQRYSATRRLHPLAGDNLSVGIRRDHDRMSDLRQRAAVINTSTLNVHELRAMVQERYTQADGNLSISLVSFGFRAGIPTEADLIFDVRFLKNPYFEAHLSARDGTDLQVKDYIFSDRRAYPLIGHIESFLSFTLPHYQSEGKLYLTVAIGCTGGRHRSVVVAEELAKRFEHAWDTKIRHRDIDRGAENE